MFQLLFLLVVKIKSGHALQTSWLLWRHFTRKVVALLVKQSFQMCTVVF